MYTAIIVEDMPQAMQLLESDLTNHCKDIEIIGKASSIVAAAKLLQKQEPDILFLDISLADGNGFDLLEIFPKLTSKVIFITASDEHAIKAFRFSAIDYLLKPIDVSLLVEAVDKVKVLKSNMGKSMDLLKETIKSPNKLPTKITLSTQDKISIYAIADIIRCESDGNNTRFFMNNNEKLYVTKTLKNFDDMLQEHNFIRVHQSHLINLDYLQEFSKKEGGFLKMKNGDEVPVSSRKKSEILEILNGMR
jgi:two-component system, LytTR family, response regulator